MAFLAQDVLKRASTILNDTAYKRWPITELLYWINDSFDVIALGAPHAIGKTVVLEMDVGSRQTLPDTDSALLRANSNVSTTDGVITAHLTAITATNRRVMDAQIPGWVSNTVLPFNDQVLHVIDDPTDVRAFYVVPGNTGNGVIEALVARQPAEIAPAVTNPEDIASYASTSIDMDERHLPSIVHYVVSQALKKDINQPGVAAMSNAHYSTFAQTLGIQVQTENAENPQTLET